MKTTYGFSRDFEMVTVDKLTSRLKVPGGWLVRDVTLEENGMGISVSTSMCFLPDPGHYWKLEPEPEEAHENG